jgi:hypothetical protein
MKTALSFAVLALVSCSTVPASGGTTGTPTAALGQTAQVGSLRVRPIAVVEDSRCPINAMCVWAGRIVVRTEIRGRRWKQVRDLELRKEQPIADGQIRLTEAAPSKLADQPIKPWDYRFTFDFQGGL